MKKANQKTKPIKHQVTMGDFVAVTGKEFRAVDERFDEGHNNV